MKIGIIGLGKMGEAIAYRLMQAEHEVIGYDQSKQTMHEAEKIYVKTVASVAEVAAQARIIWLMVPAGPAVDTVIKELIPHLKAGDVVIDGGNSNYKDSVRRAEALKTQGMFFIDCGTSGGLAGRAQGFSLMVGGDNAIYTKIHPLLVAIAAPGGVGHVGPSGAGHYVKMVHNGIEYALLQAYAEGFQLLHEGSYKDAPLDLAVITRIWNKGSVIRSWILELSHDIFAKDQLLKSISGEVQETGMGQWTIEETKEQKIPVPLLEQAVQTRAWSRKTGGNYATKVIAMLRNAFGGHKVKKGEER